jgi:hypothetical protein
VVIVSREGEIEGQGLGATAEYPDLYTRLTIYLYKGLPLWIITIAVGVPDGQAPRKRLDQMLQEIAVDVYNTLSSTRHDASHTGTK